MTTKAEHNLKSIYDFLLGQSEGLEVNTVTLGKQEFHTFHNEIVNGESLKDLKKLQKRDADSFLQIVKSLELKLEDDVNTNSCLPHAHTILHEMIKFNRMDLFIALLDHGANPLVPDAEGNNALMLAAKLARKEMLDEFYKMIDHHHAQTHTSKHTENQTEKTATNTSATTTDKETSADKKEPSAQAYTKEVNTKQNRRHALTENDLKKKNHAGETVICLLKKNKSKDDLAEKKTPTSDIKKPIKSNNVVNDFKFHIEKLPLTNRTDKSKSSQTKEIVKYTASSNHKYNKSVKLYASVFKFFDNVYYETPGEVKLNSDANIKKFPELATMPNQAKSVETNIILPYDRTNVAMALRVIKDYSEFSFKHIGRRYRKEARELIAPYFAKKDTKKLIKSVFDVVELYERLQSELNKISQFNHHKQIKNNKYNSSYCRRLSYALEELEKTEIIRNYLTGGNSFQIDKYKNYLEVNKKLPNKIRYD